MTTTLVTGGAGYIGSHTALVLAEHGHDVVIVDNLDNSSITAVEVVRDLAGQDIPFHQIDLRDHRGVEQVFEQHTIDAVVHFAALKAVGESVEQPLRYYRNNLESTTELLDAMVRHGVRDFVFSSSCTVYGEPEAVPITEDFPTGAASPYGWTKYMVEQILHDVAVAEGMRVASLRYFNPIGAHESGRLGEDPAGIPNNLLPFIMQVAVGRREKLRVFGGDYDTPDGTAVRDYIHVVDLAEGHVAALDALDRLDSPFEVINLGTGVGSSVLEVIAAADAAVGRPIPYEIVERRAGDVERTYADVTRARELLGWQATHSLAEAVASHWKWQSQNPEGFGGGRRSE